MAIINQATKELQVKIVYYGPAMGGKTTNLVQVHDHVQTAAGNKGKLVSLATSSDRTLFFDFLPIEAMSIKGFKTKFQLYTVPGQVIYNTTRQLVLRGVDGIVFVADSQYEKMAENVESFANLEDNLKTPEAQPRRHPLRAPIQQARPAQRRPGRIHGIPAEQPRGPGAVLHRQRAQVRRRVRDAQHDHPHVAAQVHQPGRRRSTHDMATLPQLIEEDIQRLDDELREFLDKSDATTALIIDKGGFLITQPGRRAAVRPHHHRRAGLRRLHGHPDHRRPGPRNQFQQRLSAGREVQHARHLHGRKLPAARHLQSASAASAR